MFFETFKNFGKQERKLIKIVLKWIRKRRKKLIRGYVPVATTQTHVTASFS